MSLPHLRRRKRLLIAVAATAVGVGVLTGSVLGNPLERPALLRVMQRVPAGARTAARPLVLTLGGPVYCAQAKPIAGYLHATLLCPDYGPDRESSGASRRLRAEDWGDPAYLDAVARLPGRLRAQGVKISELVVVGASYAAYADAELVATHPELRPRALIIVDGFLDLPARFDALHPGQPTRAEMIHTLGGTKSERPLRYRQRSPSHHLAGLAAAVRHGMRLVDVWSTSPQVVHEFNGAMCSPRSNAFWLRRLATVLDRPVHGYVTELPHAYALWYWWHQLLGLAGLSTPTSPLPAEEVTFRAGAPIPAASYCRAS